MTQQIDVARGRDIVARWCSLAEQRLEYLTELFETGRWRRYHSELAFLENIQEAKSAVETWRDLSTREASLDNSAIDLSWLGRGRATPARSDARRLPFKSEPVSIAPEPPRNDVTIPAEPESISSKEAPSAPLIESVLDLTLDIAAMQERYPLLRNAL
jgi:hypothetical protein